MYKTLRLSFSLKNTYRVNTILYSLKQIPLIKRIVPDVLYSVRELKILANVLAIIWEVIAAFLGKFLYFLVMFALASLLYPKLDGGELFLHILVILSIIGSFCNTYMFNPTKDKYYAMILMRMNAREYALTNYGYAIAKVLVGFSIFGIAFGINSGLKLWQGILIPLFVVGLKLTVTAWYLRKYEVAGVATNENTLGKFQWAAVFLLLAAAYGPPFLGYVIPMKVSLGIMTVCIVAGVISIRKILHFQSYRQVYQEMLTQNAMLINGSQQVVEEQRKQSHKVISADVNITSRREGFEYLNELFIKRHRKILWDSSMKITIACCTLFIGILVLFHFVPASKEVVNEFALSFLPFFTFVMYAINRGVGFTRVLFVNCDHSLLTYSFFKQPKYILKLFQIRLREIIKINLPPALVLGGGLAIALYLSGGTDNPLNYVVILVSICCLSVFFSVHHLTLYYLLQPYNASTEIKGATYQIINSATYIVCYVLMDEAMSTLFFGAMTIVFCVVYCIVACVLVYFLAPKTFKIRN